jgi:nicotinamidase-related amidase
MTTQNQSDPSVSIIPARAAALCMDCQTGIVSIYAKQQEGMLTRAASVLERARALGMCVIYIRVGFRPGLPEISTRNLLFRRIKSSPDWWKLFDGEAGTIHVAVAPQGSDIVVVKHRVSALAGTDLQEILRAKDIDTLVLFGISTSGVVLSTMLDAADADYRLVVIKDCCIDSDSAVHECLVDKVFPRQASVMTSNEFLEITAKSA